MLVVLAYYPGNEDQASRLADWIAELGPYQDHSFLVERDKRCQTDAIYQKLLLAGFDKVEEIVNPVVIDGWPQGGNNVFQFAARHISYVCPQPWLWIEPDAIPMRKGWLNELEQEYKENGKPFMGDFVSVHTPELDVPDHMSGVAVYPPDLVDAGAGEGLITQNLAWDVIIAPYVLRKMHISNLISHAWKHPTFENWEQVEREVFAFKPECVLFHASKDGSLIDLLRIRAGGDRNGNYLRGEPQTGSATTTATAVTGGNVSGGSEGSDTGRSVPPSQFSCDILIKTYPKDYEWLSYCLRGLEKFATGFRKIIVVHPVNESGPTFPENQPIPIYQMPVQENGDPYLFQQAVKFSAHDWTDADYVLHIDSDTVPCAPFTPETFFRDGKPLWLMTPYSAIRTPWQIPTEKFLGEPVEFEFMRRFPILLPRKLHLAASKFVTIRHTMSASEYIVSQPGRDFSEFNALGALAYYQARDDFRWLDTTKEELPPLVAIQSWSHGGLTDQLREKFENILSGDVESRHVNLCNHSDPAKQSAGEDSASGSSAPPAQNFMADSGHAQAATGPTTHAVPTVSHPLPVPVLADPLLGGEARESTVRPATLTADSRGGQFISGIHQTKEGWWVIDGDTHISKWVEEEGRLDHDRWLLPKILPEINEGDTVVDAGAFIGDHTIAYLKAVGEKGKVLAFEPNPLAFECLVRNMARKIGKYALHNRALSDNNGDHPFEILDNAGASGFAEKGVVSVKTLKLDSLNPEQLNFFKIDVEGHELAVLKGANQTIERCRPKLLIEINKWALIRQGVEAYQIFQWLKDHYYKWSSVQPLHIADPPHYDIICYPLTREEKIKKLIPWESPLASENEIRRLIGRLKEFVAGATPSQMRFVRQELVIHGVTKRPKDYNWTVIRKKRNAMKKRLQRAGEAEPLTPEAEALRKKRSEKKKEYMRNYMRNYVKPENRTT